MHVITFAHTRLSSIYGKYSIVIMMVVREHLFGVFHQINFNRYPFFFSFSFYHTLRSSGSFFFSYLKPLLFLSLCLFFYFLFSAFKVKLFKEQCFAFSSTAVRSFFFFYAYKNIHKYIYPSFFFLRPSHNGLFFVSLLIEFLS